MLRILFHTPEIPGNTGNAIRLAAVTGAELHLVEPLGFDFGSAHLRRAGLDYHDLAVLTVHPDLDALSAVLAGLKNRFTCISSATVVKRGLSFTSSRRAAAAALSGS